MKDKKKTFLQIISLLIIFLIFFAGWFYLESIFNIFQPFDFNVYIEPNDGTISQEKSITSTVIVFSNLEKSKPVELYVSNCPKYTTCSLSINNANPTYTSELTVTPTELTPTGTYPVSIFAVGVGIKKTSTYYLTVKPKECICTRWISQGCGGRCTSQMYMVRDCEPKDCDIESRCAYNSSCIKDFSIESIPSYREVVNQKASFIIKITSINKFSGLVYLYASNCPLGSICSYSISPIDVPSEGVATSSLNIQAALATVMGDFTITTTGISNDTIHSTNSTTTIT